MAGDDKPRNGGNLATNRKALHDYSVVEKFEAGIELLGTEIKVVRAGSAGLVGAWAKIEQDGQLFVNQMHIPPYEFGNRFNHEAMRPRRLLMHKKEILKLKAQSEQKGLALIPLRLYLTPKGKVKVELGLCRGKAVADKRETVKRRDADRETRRAIADRGRY